MTRTGEANSRGDRPSFVTHLECSASGEHYAAGRVHGLSRACKPLLVRYDLEAVRAHLTKDALAARPPDLWKWRELLPVRRAEDIITLGEGATPLVPLDALGREAEARAPSVKDEGRL